jgi:CTD kinase subunit gamma
MHFIEHLCDMAQKSHHQAYVSMMNRDICKIVDAVAPEDGSGSANVKLVRRVLQALGAKGHLALQTISEIDELLLKRDTKSDDVELSPANDDTEMSGMGNGTAIARTNGIPRLDKKLVEQRLEEDRERHKRLRENMWAVPPGGADAEFDKLWEETSDIGDDDFDLNDEEVEENKAKGREWKEKYLSEKN